MDSNHRSRKTADLQSAPFGHSGIRPFYLSHCAQQRKRDLAPPLKNQREKTFAPASIARGVIGEKRVQI